MKLSPLLWLVPTVSLACVPISGDRILGSHLALADATLHHFPVSVTIGFAPNPGVARSFSSAEISRLARANGVMLQGPPSDVCFELAVQPVTSEAATTAMRSSLAPNATFEIVELQSSPAPVGEIHFPITSLEPGNDVRLWRGFVQYAATRRAPLWAKVRVRNAVEPPAVRRGDVVQVDVRSGSAHIRLDAVAQRDARSGDVVELLNPVSGKRFHARMEGSVAVLAIGGAL